ncbi:hypothetical protein A2738_03965 [Candidatus Nomurabacteria bacterium RIFCSPHIGHO2_01_FULL_42_15]|uniref:Uncharacterized protein n=1 Tax=Candidatus Nomurabacteria bacterium RIFCSPHIGHO2_01_FULL_42_15 TaxID=1801742 RepID=A0A1F6VEE8_9BACT|nr:MAG: hypothetical protein A2738_03965 [Candidatus Nomurabacteria bacterium RIFCSPHIGHO2_01_FULL_42_15]OGI93358.1 MAG: hypothetical protein A3A99_03820 [Candidatus Nomurabacteria bacterium RIFCSPLOWO2_01_FULL_41_18]
MENNISSNGDSSKLPNKKNLIIMGVILVVVIVGVVIMLNARQSDTQSAVEGCKVGDRFSQMTGEPCSGDVGDLQIPCKEGDLYNIVTGEPCAEGN